MAQKLGPISAGILITFVCFNVHLFLYSIRSIYNSLYICVFVDNFFSNVLFYFWFVTFVPFMTFLRNFLLKKISQNDIGLGLGKIFWKSAGIQLI